MANLAALDAMLEQFLQGAADEFAQALAENIGHSDGGLGVHYSGLPNRSSSPAQYPRRQSGEPEGSVYTSKEDPLEYMVGLEAEHGFYLEGINTSGNPKAKDSGNRYPITRTAQDPRTQQRMLNAGARSVK